METISKNLAFGGEQGVYRHASAEIGTDMTFAVYVPPHETGAKLPVIWYLSGLTCTHANVMEKGEYRRTCAELGLIFVAPDTSPRGEDVPDDDGYDFGKGAGFYVNATQEPWVQHYRMRSYIERELPDLVGVQFPADMSRQGIMGHSMGGHGALTTALRNPERFKSVSAFAPIAAPMDCPWGEKALAGYLGSDRAAWRAYDACALIEDGARLPELWVDQGSDDQFLEEQLKPESLSKACTESGIDLTLNMRAGYDHSYYFISTFMEEQLRWHAARL
ncbi:S-formylglutathione hydrolase [Sphingorhabdus sp. Alg239-R122]|uniref:S-formylglutathione hydrolase n=1 Tax=Sphingorhabdus sp. Alg239-R122 TaxID=2305989 RepID=UPI0013DB52EC|nr:S-formylglutathione hydrolase [Sphingorhabdus sp. Alg239-R122]